MGKTSKLDAAAHERLATVMSERRKELPAGSRRSVASLSSQNRTIAEEVSDEARDEIFARLSLEAMELLLRFGEDLCALDDNGRLYKNDVERESGAPAPDEEARKRDIRQILQRLI